MSETSKYRSLTVEHCTGNGVDLGSQGDPVVPWAIQVDLPDEEFRKYSGGQPRAHTIHWKGDCRVLPFKDETLDWVYNSHLLEDFWPWTPLLIEWKRVIKPGGKIIILIPDCQLWAEAIRRGQPPNCAHKHEGTEGELSTFFPGWNIIRDSRTNLFQGDYSLLFIAQKPF